MPAKNPRLTITLQPSVHAVLQRLSHLSDESQSSIVAGVLEQSLPVFERLAKIFEAAAHAKTALSEEMGDSLKRAQAKIEGQLGLSLDLLDDSVHELLGEAEKVARRAGGGGVSGAVAAATETDTTPTKRPKRGPTTPVPVTRGSGLPPVKKTGKKKGASDGLV
jgi:hypothetical protein